MLHQLVAQINSQGLNTSLLSFVFTSLEDIQHLSFVLSIAQQTVTENTDTDFINFYYLPDNPEQALKLIMTTYLNMGGNIAALIIALEYCLSPTLFHLFLENLDHQKSLACT